MSTAYILVSCEPGCEIIVKVTADDGNKLRDTISRDIRRIEKVKSTQTMTVIEGDKGGHL